MPEQLRPESKDLGEAATFIPHSSKAFIQGQGTARPMGYPPLSDPPEPLRILLRAFREHLFRDAHVLRKRPRHVGDILRHIRPRQVEAARREVRRIRLDHHAVQRKDRDRLAQVIRAPLITDPARDADIETHRKERLERFLISCIAVDDRARTDGFVTGKAGDEVLRRVPLVKEERLSQFLCEQDQLLEVVDLILLPAVHAVIVEPRLSHRQDAGIRGQYFLDARHVLLLRFVGAVRMDSRRPVDVMGLREIIHELILLRLRACQDTLDPCGVRVLDDLLRMGEGFRKKIQSDIVVGVWHSVRPFIGIVHIWHSGLVQSAPAGALHIAAVKVHMPSVLKHGGAPPHPFS